MAAVLGKEVPPSTLEVGLSFEEDSVMDQQVLNWSQLYLLQSFLGVAILAIPFMVDSRELYSGDPSEVDQLPGKIPPVKRDRK